MAKYYIAADGGGSKLQAVLYDESLHVVRTVRVAGVIPFFKPVETVRENIQAMKTALLANLDE